MGLLSKLIKKTGEAISGPTPPDKSFEQKKITNPLVKKRVPKLESKQRTNQEFEALASPLSPKLGELYSPVKSTIQQIQTGKKGVRGENLAKRVKEFAPNVSGSEKNFANVQLEPKKKYTQKELLDLLGKKVDDYDVRIRGENLSPDLYRKRVDGTPMKGPETLPSFKKTQRQKIEDKELDYFELTVHMPVQNPNVEKITQQHFSGGVTAHTRVSLREDDQGKRYILIEESQSDAARMAGEPVPDFQEEDFDMGAFDEDRELVARADAVGSDQAFELSAFSNESAVPFSDKMVVATRIIEDPILSKATTRYGGKHDENQLQITFQEIENAYKNKETNIIKDLETYYKDLAKDIDDDVRSRIDFAYLGDDIMETEVSYLKKIDSSRFSNKQFYEHYKDMVVGNKKYLGEEFEDGLSNIEFAKYDAKGAKKNAEELIEKLKNKYPSLKDDKLFTYKFLTSQDATTLFKFDDVVKERSFEADKSFSNDFIIKMSENAQNATDTTKLDELYAKEHLDPINRIFTYAFNKDFQNHVEETSPKYVETKVESDDILALPSPFDLEEGGDKIINRLSEKIVTGQRVSANLYDISDAVFRRDIDRRAAGVELEMSDRQREIDIENRRTEQKGYKVLYDKSDVPVNTRMEIMLSSLKSAIILAKKQGIDEIVVPSAREISRLRGASTKYDDAFEKLYTDGLRKALNQLQQDTKGNIKVSTRVLRHDPEGSFEPDFMLDDKPMYDKDKYRESFATSINIRELLFDPETEALRFNMGGSVPPRALISDDAKREALLAGININRMMS